jgi:DNA invertase Pin-like site-specific DNA recombinase
VSRYVEEARLALVGEFTEIETGRSPARLTLERRPQLQAALAEAKRRKALLVIATLDRLSRNVAFIASLIESAAEFVAADMPAATRFMLHIYAAVAEEEGRLLSERVKSSLAAARVRGKRWDQIGGRRHVAAVERAEALRPAFEEIARAGHHRPCAVMHELNRRKVPAPRGGMWHIGSVRGYLRYLADPEWRYSRGGAATFLRTGTET